MSARNHLILVCIALALAAPWIAHATDPVTFAPASIICAGKPFWIDSHPDPKKALINARVDIGTMKQVGDEIEMQIMWPSAPGFLRDFRASHPDLKVPDGSQFLDRERVVCGPQGEIFYSIESTVIAPDGTLLYRKTKNPVEERPRVEAREKELRALLRSHGGYGPNPRSLVCWAAARKCEGKDFSWPPPPNQTPLEYSDRATRMREDYNRMFIPTCKLK